MRKPASGASGLSVSPENSVGEPARVRGRGCGQSECHWWGSLVGAVAWTELPLFRHGLTTGQKPESWLFAPPGEASCITRNPRTGVRRGVQGNDVGFPGFETKRAVVLFYNLQKGVDGRTLGAECC